MAWWDWFLRPTPTRAVSTVEESTATDVVPEPSPDAPRVGTWSFERAPTPSEAVRDVSEVVRDKAAARADRPTFRAADRGVAPIAVPSLRERALTYRVDAAAAEPKVAADLWRRCVDLEPHDASAWYAYGKALFESERPTDAVGALERALACAPDDAVTLAALGFVTAALGDDDAALGWYAQAAARSPDTDTLHGLARAQEATGRHAEAAATRARLDL